MVHLLVYRISTLVVLRIVVEAVVEDSERDDVPLRLSMLSSCTIKIVVPLAVASFPI
jgi:hypothetical protein